MGYVSREQALRMRRSKLVDQFIETQTMAAAAISVALTFGGIEAERAIMERFERDLSAPNRALPAALAGSPDSGTTDTGPAAGSGGGDDVPR